MARINVEDSLWSDPRFMRLIVKIGNEFTAIGAVVSAWKIAHRYWCPDKKPIPEAAFKEAGLPEALIEVALADRTPEGIRIRGSEEHFAWWFDKRSAGIRSAEVRKKKFGTAQPGIEHRPNTSEHCSNTPEPLTLTPPLTLKKEYTYAHSAPRNERMDIFPFEAPEKPLVGGGGSQIADALRKAYALYPRKAGKTPGLTRLKPQIKTLEDAEAFTQAVKNFRRQMEHEGREVDKILYFSTFCSKTNWVDWINPDGKLFRDEVTSLHTNEEIGDLG